METEQAGFGFETGEPDHATLREASADFTPMPVVSQFTNELRHRMNLVMPERHRPNGITLLDPSAGAGAFGLAVKRMNWELTETIGVELRADETTAPDHYDDCHMGGSFLDYEPHVEPDIIATNPPFHLWEEFVRHAMECVSPIGYIAFLGLNGWGQRSESGCRLFEEFPPFEQWRIPGAIGFRGPGINPKTGKPWGTDTRDYSWWIWRGRGLGRQPAWLTRNLPRLPSSQRKWHVKPGTEES